jgi:hypothetical protein
MITTSTKRITHEEAFCGFDAKLCLSFLRDISKAVSSPGAKMCDVGTTAMEGLEGSSSRWKSRGNGDVEEIGCRQGSLTPVSFRELSGCHHGTNSGLNYMHEVFDLAVHPVLVWSSYLDLDSL